MREISARQIPHIPKLAVLLLALSTASAIAQSNAATQPAAPAPQPGQAMKQFVFIFRQGSVRQLSPEEQAKRYAEILAWARKWIGEGYSFDPRQLGHETYRIAPDGESDGADERTIGNLLFLKAKDFDDAVRIAKTHPGVRFGTHIEVRAWTPPGPPPDPPQGQASGQSR